MNPYGALATLIHPKQNYCNYQPAFSMTEYFLLFTYPSEIFGTLFFFEDNPFPKKKPTGYYLILLLQATL